MWGLLYTFFRVKMQMRSLPCAFFESRRKWGAFCMHKMQMEGLLCAIKIPTGALVCVFHNQDADEEPLVCMFTKRMPMGCPCGAFFIIKMLMRSFL